MFCELFSWKRRGSPSAVASNTLASLDFLIKFLIYPFSLLSFEIMWGQPTGRTRRDCVMLKVADSGPGGTFYPKGGGFTFDHFNYRFYILLRQMGLRLCC